MFESRMLRRIFGTREKELTGSLEIYIMRCFIVCTS
jgi:hypothetical protein